MITRKKQYSVSIVVVFFLLTSLFIFHADSLAQGQKPIIIKYAHQLPESQPVAKQARFFEKCVKEKSKGNVIIEVYPAAQLFTARDLLPAVRKGAVDIAAPVSSPMVGMIPLMELWDLPFLVKDWNQVYKIKNGYPGQVLKGEMEKAGLHYLAEGYYGFVSISNSKREIRMPKDIEGLKIRAIGPLPAEMVRAMGGGVVVMGGDEAYMGLARKTVDGGINGVVSMATRNYWEVQKYVTLLNIYYNPIPMVMNVQSWNNLPKEVQGLLQQCADESDEFVFKESSQFEKEAVEILRKNGMIVHDPTQEEIEAFKKATQPIRDSWAKKHGDIAAKMVKWIEDLK